MNARLFTLTFPALFPAVTGCAAASSPQDKASGPSAAIVQASPSPLIALAAEEAGRYIYCTTVQPEHRAGEKIVVHGSFLW